MFLSLCVKLGGLDPEDASSALTGFHGKLGPFHRAPSLRYQCGYSEGFGSFGWPLGKSQSPEMHWRPEHCARSCLPLPPSSRIPGPLPHRTPPPWSQVRPTGGSILVTRPTLECCLSLGSLPGSMVTISVFRAWAHSSFLEGRQGLLVLLLPG